MEAWILAGMTQNDKRYRKFRPQPLAPVLDALLRDAPGARRRRGFAALKRDWPSVAGPDFADMCWPERFDPGRKGRPGALVVRSLSGAALLLQHEAPRLAERVNAFLGTDAVGRIRIMPGAPPPPKVRRLPPAPLPADDPRAQALARRAERIESERLSQALTRLGRAVAGAAATSAATGPKPPRSRS